MKRTTGIRSGALALVLVLGMVAGTVAEDASVTNLHQLSVQDIDGNEVRLAEYRGDVLLIVNVASKCGFTKQYGGLQQLYTEYKDKGFAILGFPANNFMWQEPGSNSAIKQFCSRQYGVTFPMFAKISVKGSDQHPLYKYLTSKETNPEHSGKITWNFNKFLVGRNGRVIDRFGSRTKPKDEKLVEALEKALAEKP